MTISRTAKVYGEIRSCLTPLLYGTVICIDPSIGSSSSQPGWAIYMAGHLIRSGILKIDPTGDIPTRLQELRRLLRNLYQTRPPDVLVYEDIPAQRHAAGGAGGNAVGHASLLKALGAILSVSGPRHFVGILPVSWKRLARPTYEKGDEADAIEIGWIVLQEARRILETDPPGKKRSGK